jgi:outer membrane protein
MNLIKFTLPWIVAVAMARADASVDLTLDQALAAVEHANVTTLLSREAVAQAVEAANQQRVNVLPHIALTASQQRALIVSSQVATLVQSGPGNRFNGLLTANYNLLDPSQIENYRSARTAVQGAQLNYQATLQSVLAVVADAYFTHLHDRHRTDVLDSNLARDKSLLDLAQAQLHAGVATQIDVTRAEAELATDEQARLQQDTTVYQSELQFKRLLDLDLGPPLKLADFFVQQADTTEFDVGTEQHAFAVRPDYLSGKSLLKQNQQDVLAAKFENLPTLSLAGDYGQAQLRAFDGKAKEEWLASVQFNLPIFDGLKARADRRAALSHLRAQERSLRDLTTQVSSEVRLAIQDTHSRFAQIALAQKSFQLADEQLRLASLRFKQGVADNQEVIDAQNGLAVAEDGLNDAIYQYNLSRVELARAKGEVREILQEKAP